MATNNNNNNTKVYIFAELVCDYLRHSFATYTIVVYVGAKSSGGGGGGVRTPMY